MIDPMIKVITLLIVMAGSAVHDTALAREWCVLQNYCFQIPDHTDIERYGDSPDYQLYRLRDLKTNEILFSLYGNWKTDFPTCQCKLVEISPTRALAMEGDQAKELLIIRYYHSKPLYIHVTVNTTLPNDSAAARRASDILKKEFDVRYSHR